ncbi:MAG TPA: ATP-binding protein [Candidatus Lokiarchaeia archaeon]|nr:ATP-binding protein [Candidatus Lokiarchaeia archaeon]
MENEAIDIPILSPDSRTIKRILLLVASKENEQLLLDFLSQQYEIFTADSDNALEKEFDLCLLDTINLDLYWDQIPPRKAREEKTFLPFLLISSRNDVKLSTRQMWKIISEIIFTPVEKMELYTRIEVLLQLRNVTKDLATSKKDIIKENQELKLSNADLDSFAYIVSHDLREPLLTMISFMQLIKRRNQDQLDEKGIEYIDRAVNTGKNMQNMMIDVLAYSRVSTQGQVFERCDLNEVLEETLEMLRDNVQRSNAQIASDNLPALLADRVQIRQVFQNLISNAIKFCDKDFPVIHISAAETAGAYCVSVRDNGPGIQPENLPKLFKMFYREDRKLPGFGVGLAICQRIIARHGGKIWVESQPGLGSTFFFSLPQ